MRELDFTAASGTHVVFGVGKRSVARSLLDGHRALIVATPGRLPVATQIADGVPFSDVPQHVPRATVEEAAATVEENDLDAAVAVGGGSPIGVVKALAMHFDLLKVYVPTTFSGSEMTNIWAVTESGGKKTARDERVRADHVVYDPELVVGMPLPLAFVGLFNAMAHAVEALYAKEVPEEVLDDAQQSVRSIATAVRRLATPSMSEAGDLEARAEALYGAHLAATTLDRAGMGLHHKIAHVLGGTLNLRHAEAHTVVLPYSLGYNADCIPEAMARLHESLGGDPVGELLRLQQQSGVPMSLAEIGMKESDIDVVVRQLMRDEYDNPRPLERDALRSTLEAAWAGELGAR